MDKAQRVETRILVALLGLEVRTKEKNSRDKVRWRGHVELAKLKIPKYPVTTRSHETQRCKASVRPGRP